MTQEGLNHPRPSKPKVLITARGRLPLAHVGQWHRYISSTRNSCYKNRAGSASDQPAKQVACAHTRVQ